MTVRNGNLTKWTLEMRVFSVEIKYLKSAAMLLTSTLLSKVDQGFLKRYSTSLQLMG